MSILKIVGVIVVFLLIVVGIVIAAMFLLGPKKMPIPEKYGAFIGRWENQMGEYFSIYPDGTGEYKGSNSSISGGRVHFESDQFFKIAFGPFHKSFEISGPVENTAEGTFITVNGGRFIKKIDSAIATSQKLTAEEAAKLNQRYLGKMNEAVQKDDITPFYEAVSLLWKSQITPEAMKGIFQEFFTRKFDFSPWLKNFPEKATLKENENGVIEASNDIVNDNGVLSLIVKYYLSNGQFEVVGININIAKKS